MITKSYFYAQYFIKKHRLYNEELENFEDFKRTYSKNMKKIEDKIKILDRNIKNLKK